MRKKRRKAVYVPYDYEAAYKNSLDKMEEANEERILKEGKVKSIYATKEIRSGDQLEVEIYPEFTKGQKDQIPDEGKRKRQRQAQKNLNDKNSKKMCERVISENFTDRDIWATFTYTDDNMPASMEVATKNMQNYIRRLNYQRKKQGLSNARYVYVTECSEKGRWHHHIVMDGDVDMDTVEAVWNLGKRNEIRRLQRDENGLVGMARYITKEKSKKGKYQKTWCASKGLRKPKEKVNHYKTKQKDVDRIVKGDLNVCDHLMKWYGDKYDFAEAEVKYNTFKSKLGVLFPKLIGGSSTTYFKSAFYGTGSAGVRCPWRFANLNYGGAAGLAAGAGDAVPGNSNWHSRPRLCGAGKKRGEWSA